MEVFRSWLLWMGESSQGQWTTRVNFEMLLTILGWALGSKMDSKLWIVGFNIIYYLEVTKLQRWGGLVV